jgi:diaminohydroxyphosphoribosylaminopyrimidine deaminase/5-amino-6-(5-phosphoribosylamino)uracil reductase
MTIKNDQYFMRLALREAKKGIGRTSPNPCVGAVIVKDGEVIAKGYHKKAGTPHAEINALRKAGNRAVGAEMYVTLEPCNHYGKTPPCSHAVAEAGIRRVVVGMEDPNPLVDGTGISYLRLKGIETTSGVLEQECRDINLPFIKNISSGLPFMVMKAGVSLDGKLNYSTGKPGWITGPQSGRKVHQLRNIYDAILVGSNTIKIDNPSLTTRLPRGKGKDPVRIILDRTLSIQSDSKALTSESNAPTWIFCSDEVDQAKITLFQQAGIKLFPVATHKGKLDLKAVCQCLGENGITSVLVEGGGAIHGGMLQQRIYDYAHLFVAPIFAGSDGVSLLEDCPVSGRENAVSLEDVRYSRMGNDMMVSGKVVYPHIER